MHCRADQGGHARRWRLAAHWAAAAADRARLASYCCLADRCCFGQSSETMRMIPRLRAPRRLPSRHSN